MRVALILLALLLPLCAQAADKPLSPEQRIHLLEQEVGRLRGEAEKQVRDQRIQFLEQDLPNLRTEAEKQAKAEAARVEALFQGKIDGVNQWLSIFGIMIAIATFVFVVAGVWTAWTGEKVAKAKVRDALHELKSENDDAVRDMKAEMAQALADVAAAKAEVETILAKIKTHERTANDIVNGMRHTGRTPQTDQERAAVETVAALAKDKPQDQRSPAELWALAQHAMIYGTAEQAAVHLAQADADESWTWILRSRNYQTRGDLTAARSAAQSALSLALSASNQNALANAYDELGNIAQAGGDLKAAREAFEQSKAVREILAARDPANNHWQRELSVSWNKLGDVAQAEGDLKAAREAFEHGKNIAEILAARDPANSEWQRDLSVSWNKLGDVAKAEGDLKAARKAFEQSKAVREILAARDPANSQWQRDLSISWDRLGGIALAQGDAAQTRQCFEQARAIIERLIARDSNYVQWRVDATGNILRLADVDKADGNTGSARTGYSEAAARLSALQAAGKLDAYGRKLLAEAQEKLADLDRQPPSDPA